MSQYCVATNSAKPTLIPTGGVIEPSTYNITTWSHAALVACGGATVLVSLAKSIKALSGPQTWIMPIFAILVGYILGDLIAGVIHWALDNFGEATTPIFGPMIRGFQNHHKFPEKITTKPVSEHLYDTAVVAMLLVVPFLPLVLVVDDPTILALIGSLTTCFMFSSLIHKWAHTNKSQLPKIVRGLQESGLIVSGAQHEGHHQPPHNRNYCPVSGVWDKVLDENQIFEKLEMLLFFAFGVRPRTSGDQSTEKSS